MVRYRSYIVDDEIQAINALQLELQSFEDVIEVIGTASSVAEAVSEINENSPDLVFLDIRLTDGTGFDVLQNINNKDIRVIFTTAYSEYAIQAFKFNSLDYLLKPVNSEELSVSINKLTTEKQDDYTLRIQNLLANVGLQNTEKKIAIPSTDGIHLFEIKNILYLNAERNYSKIYFTQEKPLLCAKTLKEFEHILQDMGFLRIHQSYLVNMRNVASYINKDGGYLVMKDKSTVPVSSRKRNEVLSFLKGI